MKKDIKKQVEYYSKLPYQVVIEQWDDGDGPYYVARVIELDGCMMTGDTPEEAVRELEEVKPEWIETHLELGNKMPEPLSTNEYSGKVVLRLPGSVHKDLARMAALEGVSLNQYMVATLSKQVGRDEVLVKEKKATYKPVKKPKKNA